MTAAPPLHQSPPESPPDWGTSAAELTCPLCEYNLRGLTVARCPECGFTFRWAELLDATRDRHPWLFEHGRGRDVRTFVATYVRTMLPHRFWRQVTPANPVQVRRLVLYWLLVCLPLCAVALWTVPVQVVRQTQINSAERASYLPLVSTGNWVNFPGTGYHGPLTRAALDAEYPPPWSAAFALRAWNDLDLKSGLGPVAVAVAVPVAWPWATFAALLVFQTSMRRAKINPAHVLRVAVYGCDFGPSLAAIAAAAVTVAATVGRQWSWDLYTTLGIEPEAVAVVFVILCAAAIAAYRTGVAYARYLRFHWPVPTVLAAQSMAALAVLAALATHLIGRW